MSECECAEKVGTLHRRQHAEMWRAVARGADVTAGIVNHYKSAGEISKYIFQRSPFQYIFLKCSSCCGSDLWKNQ
jgi:hypothetical protein